MFQLVGDHGNIGFEGVGTDQWRQEFTLWPTNTGVIFALAGPRRINAHPPRALLYVPADGTIKSHQAPRDRIEYEVISTNSPQPGPGWKGPDPTEVRKQFTRIYAFARLPEVCGVDRQGRNLADLRMAQNGITPLDAQIARNIESYLRKHFSYTLDLTDAQQIRGQDPLEAFLYRWKRGHCEYFAGAMTLMCQTLGMQARMVIGFKAVPANYNDFTQSYGVYDSDAHAWVEVKTPKGWEPFDPTSSRTDERRLAGLFPKLRHFMEFLEFKYANAVIAYDAQSRASVIVATESAMSGVFLLVGSWVARLSNWVAHPSEFGLNLVLAALGALLLASVGWFIGERWRLLRRAQRIGIESLPEAQQLKLARQLAFYDEMMRMLEARRIVRAPHQTPLEFGRSLAFLPPAIYDTVLRLTRLFYQVRYGGVELTAWRRKRLETVLTNLGRQLENSADMRRA
jgi:transglutaminase-like putative cysteine protease